MILTNRFNPDVRVLKEAKYLVNIGYNVEVLCWDRGELVQEGDEIIQGIKIKRFWIPSRAGSGFKQLPSYLKFLNMCKRYIKKNNYDFLHCHDLDGAIIGCLISNHKKDKMIFDMHEFYESGRLERVKKMVRIFINYIQNRSYKILYVNDTQIQNVKASNKSKLIYLPNYPEAYKFRNLEKVTSEKLRIVYTGHPRHFFPLKALMDASVNNNLVEIKINGYGPDYEKLKKIEPNYNNVKVTGKYSHDDIAKLYSETDLVYCVYNTGNVNNETALPTKFFEAIISEKPIIVNKKSYMADICTKYDIGYLVDPLKPESIATIISNILNDRNDLEEKRNNIGKIKNKYSWEKVVTNLNEAY